MSHITIKWNGEEGIVTIGRAFQQLYNVARWDCLQDAIHALTEIYINELDAWHNRGEVISMAKKAAKKPVKKAAKVVKLVKKTAKKKK